MYTCERCGCNYDAGEIRNGICIDCWERQQERAERRKSIRKMMHQPSYQLMLDLESGGTVKRLKC